MEAGTAHVCFMVGRATSALLLHRGVSYSPQGSCSQFSPWGHVVHSPQEVMFSKLCSLKRWEGPRTHSVSALILVQSLNTLESNLRETKLFIIQTPKIEIRHLAFRHWTTNITRNEKAKHFCLTKRRVLFSKAESDLLFLLVGGGRFINVLISFPFLFAQFWDV